MKAVILNSSDKLAGIHGSTRDVVKADGTTKWTDTAAYSDVTIPLDEQLGAGELNAYRAVQQLAPGEYNPGNVPMIGWDYHTIGEGQLNEYILSQPVTANSYIAVTLAWDRNPQKIGGNNYSYGDGFFNYGTIDEVMDNLNLRILTADGTDIVAASLSSEMNLEHIFFKFQNDGQYKIVVSSAGGPVASQNYGLAWWYGESPPLALDGDYNGDGNVDPADLVMWRKDPSGLGQGDDYDVWRENFSDGASSSFSLASVPEPSTIVMSFVCLSFVNPRMKRAG
jgi:hypothetical protein